MNIVLKNAVIKSEVFSMLELTQIEKGIGHGAMRHIAKSDEFLKARILGTALENGKKLQAVSEASTFTDFSTAWNVVSKTLEKEIYNIRAWAKTAKPDQLLPLEFRGNQVIGRVLRSSIGVSQDATNATIKIIADGKGGWDIFTYFVK